ncbi:PBSX family phage terminase large subunit [Acinetobacter piscicola]|uniref:PBSX family phage terminase large subunit n=1 Tax=Acinetobacter piscicola TaxID=2006115 RepID=UPI00102123F7|nr:PBSX family phage terminase large subunit [Acinetobacter piscicola]RYL25101.1 PBSX family phage terminase large subunit [Acinetobacter piscicola]
MGIENDIEIPEKLLPAFDNLSKAIYDAIVWEGGRGGAKSEALAHIGIMESYIDDGVILCCREIQKSIDDSIYSMLVAKISQLGLDDQFKILNNEITNLVTGARFIFAGLKSNVTSIKSITKLRVVLVDEAENVSQNSWDVLRPTPRYGKVRIYVVFNPKFETDPTWQEFVAKKDERTLHINIGWRDNPWFPESLNNQRLRDAKGDAGRYLWIWEGKFLKLSEASIFGKKLRQREFEIDESFGDPMLGVDWGFSTDPVAAIEAYVKDRTLYIRNAASRVGLELDDTAAWLYRHIPKLKTNTSRADSSRPETISKVQKDKECPLPLLKACVKWSGSVEDGVVYIQSFDEIVIHPDADDCYAELMAYSYKKDKFDEVTTEILDKDNHYADALRYALEPKIKGKRRTKPKGAGSRTY